jgi:hypothetical protein
MERRPVNPTQSLQKRLAEEAKRLRAKAKLLPPGAKREDALRKKRGRPKPDPIPVNGCNLPDFCRQNRAQANSSAPA